MLYNKLYTKKTFIKQFIAYFTLSVMAISIIGIMIYYTAIGIIEDEAEKFYLTQVKSVKNSIDNRFEEFNKLNFQISNSRLFNKVIYMQNGIDYTRINVLDFMTMQQELATFKSINSFIDEVFVYFNNDGLVLTSTGKDKVEYFFSNIFKIEDDRLFNIAMLKNNNKDAQIIPNLEATYLGRRYNSMVYVQGILSSHNKTYESSLIILTKTNRINEILGSFSSKGAFNINIINNKNEIIASHGSLPLHKGNKNYYSYKGYDSIFRDKIEGIEYIIYHIPSDINELEYVAIAPLSIVIKKAEQFKKIFITTFTSAIIFTMIMVTMVTTKSLDPLKRIIFTLLKDDNYNYSKNEYRTEFEVIENCINSLKHEKSLMQLELQKYNYLQKNNLITALLKGNLMYSPDEEDIFIKYGISFPYSFFRVFIFEIEQYIEDYNKINEEKDYYITPEIILIIKSMMENILTTLKYVSYVVEIDQSKVVILMNINDMPGPSEFDFSIKHSNVNQVLRKIKEEIEDKFGIIITVGIGNTYNTFAGISQSYKEAQKALNFKLLKGKSSIIIFKEINYCEGQLHYYYPLDKEHALIEYLKSASFDKVEEILDSIIEENLNKQKVDITTARFLFYDLQATALKALQELNLSSFNNSMISQDLSNLNTFEEMIDYIKKVYKEICKEIKSKNNNLIESLTKEILDEIDEKYCDSNFSLNICASKFGLSDSYLSRFFKEKTGFYFSEYLNKKRIEKAKQLLTLEEMTVKDIATEVGFISDVTFRRVFKKYELMTPIEYREDDCLKTKFQT